tara:strand:- start:18 stop:242 length:225 start_codon:yes stop_codon:yes gene_type:complete
VKVCIEVEERDIVESYEELGRQCGYVKRQYMSRVKDGHMLKSMAQDRIRRLFFAKKIIFDIMREIKKNEGPVEL